ncbi:MAG: peroxide stress protein YaaA [Deltaproteobacteria bacterium]|nr:peroxide stress protein YaaA [Deltaproteobacteria bacterium]
MLVVISPAKKLDWSPPSPELPHTRATLEEESARLAEVTRKLTARKIARLMDLSESLAQLNHERFQALSFPTTPANGKQAALAFAGDTYQGLDAASLTPEDLDWAQTHLGILSGLFGLLRPLDLMQAYRLEMGTRLSNRRGKDLYAFWGKRIAARINALTEGHPDRTVVNCASVEYWKAVRPGLLAARTVTPVFKEAKDGQAKVVGFVAKRSRGLMARWIIQNRLEDPEALKSFREEDYVYQPEESTDSELVFVRPSRTA